MPGRRATWRAALRSRATASSTASCLLLLLGLLLCTAPAGAAGKTVTLSNGAMIRGEVLQQRTDRVVVDLGFEVLMIPMEEVESILDTDSNGEQQQPVDRDLYRIDPDRESLTVKENMARCAEAVVQVRTPVGLGSGFVIHPDGYVVTNQHVVAGENRLSVTLFKQGDSELENLQFNTVRIVALNPYIDLALLKIEDSNGHTFQTVPFGDSSSLRQGQPVFAVGSPLGLDRSVSQGIISLTNRVMGGKIFVQTTAQINPGNSGGPLFDLRGAVIGVNDLKLVGIGLEGLSFSIPVNVLKEFLDNRSAFAFDTRNPNAGFRYNDPPRLFDSPVAAGASSPAPGNHDVQELQN